MRPAPPNTREPVAGSNRQHMWPAFLGVLALITVSSLAGRQLFEMIPLSAVWALIASGCLAALLAMAFLYHGPLPRRALITGILLAAAAFIAAVLAGAMTPAEIAHVVFFGTLGGILSPLAPLFALPLLAAVAAGDELLQALLPWRVGSLIDVALNVVSAFGGYGLVRYHESTRAGRAVTP